MKETKTIRTLVKWIVLFALTLGCSSGDGESDLDKCLAGCTKAYEECGDTYIDYMQEHYYQDVTEEDLLERQTECEEECQDEANASSEQQQTVNCVLNALSTECRTLYSKVNSRFRAYESCLYSCEMALDCEDYLFGYGDECDSDCESQYTAYQNAISEFYYSCENELGEAYAECGYDYYDYDDECAPGCPEDYLGDGYCDDECNNADCYYDYGDCGGSTECAPGCTTDMIGDGYCDDECNNADCYYDLGDC